MAKPLRIGAFPLKKVNMTLLPFAEFLKGEGHEFVVIDLDGDIEQQGPFDAIIQKISYEQCISHLDENARRRIQKFDEYTSTHPSVVVLDPVEATAILQDRESTQAALSKIQSLREYGVMPTNQVYLESVASATKQIAKNSLSYPIICKTKVAAGAPHCHDMAIVYREEGLDDLPLPILAEPYHNHGSKIFKAYCVGEEEIHTVARLSLANQSLDGALC